MSQQSQNGLVDFLKGEFRGFITDIITYIPETVDDAGELILPESWDPYYIDGYRYNPEDGVWYGSPAQPDYGDYVWEDPADADTQIELDNERARQLELIARLEELMKERLERELERLNDQFNISLDVNDLFLFARDWIPRRDPLTLDLDGDGIETLPADGTVLFDHNGDGIKSGTGWVAPDDGLLVLDKDGNGLIETGDELFGDNTVKADGSLALNGFDALADLDSNADNRIDSNDAQFADLRIWRDLNSDGVSQANELFTLGDVGVAAVNLQNENIIQSVGNDNVTNAIGTFERTDGSEGLLESSAASLDLASNHIYRKEINAVFFSDFFKRGVFL